MSRRTAEQSIRCQSACSVDRAREPAARAERRSHCLPQNKFAERSDSAAASRIVALGSSRPVEHGRHSMSSIYVALHFASYIFADTDDCSAAFLLVVLLVFISLALVCHFSSVFFHVRHASVHVFFSLFISCMNARAFVFTHLARLSFCAYIF